MNEIKRTYRIYNENKKYIESNKISTIKYFANLYDEIEEEYQIVELETTERKINLDNTNYKIYFYLNERQITAKNALKLVGKFILEEMVSSAVSDVKISYCTTMQGTLYVKAFV